MPKGPGGDRGVPQDRTLSPPQVCRSRSCSVTAHSSSQISCRKLPLDPSPTSPGSTTPASLLVSSRRRSRFGVIADHLLNQPAPCAARVRPYTSRGPLKLTLHLNQSPMELPRLSTSSRCAHLARERDACTDARSELRRASRLTRHSRSSAC